MHLVRPVTSADIPALEAIAGGATPGVHTLPRTAKSIARAVERSLAAFASAATEEVFDPEGTLAAHSYFFVLEDARGAVCGTASIAATAGASGTFFAFRNDVLNQVSRDLDIDHQVQALILCSDLTDHSQLSGFFLRERNGVGSEAALLSRARLLFAAVAPQRFADKFFSSMAGRTDPQGGSPFWEAIGRKFFQMDFLEAERMIEGARNRTLIVELMPPYPVYVPLLPQPAQAALGKVHGKGELAFSLLSGEGFEPDRYVDLFDGGPILHAHKNGLRSFAESVRCTVVATDRRSSKRGMHLVAACREENFRVVAAQCKVSPQAETVVLDAQAMRRLDVATGDTVLCVPL